MLPAISVGALLIGGAALIPAPAEAVPAQPERIAFVKGGDIWLGDPATGHAAVFLKKAYSPSISPDGNYLAYHTPSGEYVRNIDGSNRRQISADATGYVSDWSPDSSRMVYVSPSGVDLVGVAGLTRTHVPNVPVTGVFYSSDGTFLLYAQGTSAVTVSPTGTGTVVHPHTPVGPMAPGSPTVLVTYDGPAEVQGINLVTGRSTSLAGPADAANYFEGPVWRADGLRACVTDFIDHSAPEPTTGETSGVYCDGVEFVAGYGASVGGGVRPSDQNGAPPAAGGVTATSATPNAVDVSWTPPAGVSDYAGVEIRYALGTIPPATITDGVDGGRYLSEHTATLAHLPKNQAIAVSVFTLDAFSNASVPTSASVITPNLDASTITASANPFDLVSPHSTTVSGTLTDTATGDPLPNATLTIDRQEWNSAAPYEHLGAVTTDSAGRFAFTQIPGISWNYRLSYAGTAGHAATQSVTRVRVAPSVSLKASRTKAAAGTKITLTAIPIPVRPYAKTYLYQKVGHGGARLGPHDTDSAGRVVYTVKAPPRGATRTYRVVVPGSGSYITGTSAWVTITGT